MQTSRKSPTHARLRLLFAYQTRSIGKILGFDRMRLSPLPCDVREFLSLFILPSVESHVFVHNEIEVKVFTIWNIDSDLYDISRGEKERERKGENSFK